MAGNSGDRCGTGPYSTEGIAWGIANLRYRYHTYELGSHDIHVRALRDKQQFEDDAGTAAAVGISSAEWPIFGVVWAAGQTLARLMVDYDIKGLRVLEVGCGVALTSLVLNERDCDITATDLHPRAGVFLRHNAALNDAAEIPFEQTGWADESDDLGLFDLIIGSDVLYERGHGPLLGGFIARHAHPHCRVIVVDSARGHIAKLTKSLASFGFDHAQVRAEPGDDLAKPYVGHVHSYER